MPRSKPKGPAIWKLSATACARNSGKKELWTITIKASREHPTEAEALEAIRTNAKQTAKALLAAGATATNKKGAIIETTTKKERVRT